MFSEGFFKAGETWPELCSRKIPVAAAGSMERCRKTPEETLYWLRPGLGRSEQRV